MGTTATAQTETERTNVQVDFSKIYNPYKYGGTAHVDFHRSPSRYKLIGGAMGGSKSVSGCAEGIQLSLDVPGNRGAIVRKNRTVLKRTTLVTFFQICPPEIIKSYNQSELVVRFINGSEILFLEADESKDPLFEKLKSLEIGWYFIDEASEVARGAHQALASRLRWKPAVGRYYGIVASNPEQCWVKEDFPVHSTSNPKPQHAYFQFLPKNNPYLPDDYIENLKLIYDEVQQRKYIEGDWSVADDPMQVIPYTAIKSKLATDAEILTALGDISLGVDVAELGDDKAILAYMVGSVGTGLESFSKKRIDELSGIVQSRIISKKIDPSKVGIDSVGNGAGVWGNLVGAGYNVNRLISGGKMLETERAQKYFSKLTFADLRAQMFWKLRIEVLDSEGNIRIPNIPTLLQDLTAPRYKTEAERKIRVESKDNLKKRLNRSPDEGDAFIMANWVRDFSNVHKLEFAGAAF